MTKHNKKLICRIKLTIVKIADMNCQTANSEHSIKTPTIEGVTKFSRGVQTQGLEKFEKLYGVANKGGC